MNWARYGELARKAVTLPPDVVARKAAAKLKAPFARAFAKGNDRARATSCFGREPFSGQIARRFASPPIESLRPHADLLRTITGHFLAHRFNLLGSGWVEVAHGARCQGVCGSRYEPGPSLEADRDGNWLREQVPRAALASSVKLWRLVDEAYPPIDWQLDFKSGHRWSARAWSGDVRYGHRPGADVKVPWELARMQHLPQLALAFSLGSAGVADFAQPHVYAREFRNQVLDFAATNPPRFGVNWVCTMDVALRAVSWLVAYDLFRAAGAAFDPEFDAAFLATLIDHARHIATHLEWDPTARGNHYLSDVVGLLFLAMYLPETEESRRWLVLATHEFVRECRLQFRDDGTNFEGSTSYHRLSAEIATIGTALWLGAEERFRDLWRQGLNRAWTAGPRVPAGPQPTFDLGGRGCPFDEQHLRRIARAAEFSRTITKPSGEVIQVGDHDSGRFLKLTPTRDPRSSAKWPDEHHLDQRSLVASVAGLFVAEDAECSSAFALETQLVRALARGGAPTPSELRPTSLRTPDAIALRRFDGPHSVRTLQRAYEIAAVGDLRDDLQIAAFDEFGLFVMRSRRLFLAVRCGGRTQLVTGGHEHVDQLAVELEIDGDSILRDPGTHLYTASLKEREKYRSAGAHFVPRFDGYDAEIYPERRDLGPFQLHSIARAECLLFSSGRFLGRRVVGPHTITRRVEIQAERILIVDELMGPPARPRSGTPEPEHWRTMAFSPGYGQLAEQACRPERVVELNLEELAACERLQEAYS